MLFHFNSHFLNFLLWKKETKKQKYYLINNHIFILAWFLRFFAPNSFQNIEEDYTDHISIYLEN